MYLRGLKSRLMPSASLLALFVGAGQPAIAQSAAAGSETPEQVVVTGSLLSATGFVAPTPVTALNSQEFNQIAPNSIADALNTLPQLSGSQITSAVGAVSASAGTNGENLLNLRGLGSNRLLVLLDGDRLPYSNVSGSVDINLIPQNLVSRVDIVTGGASAAYGSDAVAGVVNFVLNTHFQGFKADFNAGITQYGDGASAHAAATYGASLFGDRVRFVTSLDYYHQDMIGLPITPTGRHWFDFGWGAYTNPVAGGTPSTLQVPDVRFATGTYGGLITGVQGCRTPACLALSGGTPSTYTTQFGLGGSQEAFQPGQFASSTFAEGGDGAQPFNGLSDAQYRYQFFNHAEYDINSNVTFFAEGMYDYSLNPLDAAEPFEVGSKFQFTVFPGNAYAPTWLNNFFTANPTATSITVGRVSADMTPIINRDLSSVLRFAGGFKGNITDRWTFDTSLTYSRAIQDLDQTDTINRNLYAAADAVTNPQTGQVVCRSQYYNAAGVFVPGGTGADPGCVPLNIFGNGSVTPAANSYVTGWDLGNTVFHQTAFKAIVRGDLGDDFQLGAGPISVAAGVNYRRDDANRYANPLSYSTTDCTGIRGCPASINGIYGGYQSYNPAPLKGSVGVTEGFTEIGVPLIKGVPFAELVDLDLAGRMADYTTSGVTYSDKIGLTWDLNDEIRIRGTRSQDIRAPSLTELFSVGTSGTGPLNFPAAANVLGATPVTVQAQSRTTGNVNLQPEVAHTVTGGVVYSPSWLQGFTTSVDYYKIDIGGAITSVGGQTAVNNCYLGQTQYCALIFTNNGASPVTPTSILGINASTAGVLVKTETLNAAGVGTSGIDFEAAYGTDIFDGSLTLRGLANFLMANYNTTLTPGTKPNPGIGTPGGEKYTLSADFSDSLMDVFVEEKVISNGLMDPNLITGLTVTRNNVPMILYTNLNLAYKFDSFFDTHDELYLNITNLFNQSPPVDVTTSSSFEHSTDYSLYDVLGRRFTLGLRVHI